MPNFTAEELTTICHNVFEKLNIPAAEAEVVTRSMVDANRVGHDSHGVIHLPKYVRELEAGLIQPGASIETRHESASIAVLDGNWGFGPVIATRAVEVAIQKAKQTDISSVTVSRCNEVGRLGGIACLAAYAEMIGLLMANDHGGGTCVAPHGGVQGENIEDENGVPFQIFYGISDNSHKFWSITNARKVIGYAPEDNSAFRFAERLTELFKEADEM